MTTALDHLKARLQQQGTLTETDVIAVEAQLGPLTADERLWLSVEAHTRRQRAGDAITLEQYVQAARQFEISPPGSPESERALGIMTAFENAA
ncbi:MAG: hypothetical protein JXN59_18815 [Anaerolineae bacterium]|nr:hypothetical protein [Anaerolineae bacterium]